MYEVSLSLFLEGLTSSQKKPKADSKLSSAQKTLKKRLELSYGVEIPDKDDNASQPETHSEKHLNKLMNELKTSFMESTCYNRKLQIYLMN